MGIKTYNPYTPSRRNIQDVTIRVRSLFVIVEAETE